MLREILCPFSVQYIRKFAFYNCLQLNYILFQEGISNIDDSCFSNFEKLFRSLIPRSVRNMINPLTHCSNLFFVSYLNPNIYPSLFQSDDVTKDQNCCWNCLII
jgi:hypothetical protein